MIQNEKRTRVVTTDDIKQMQVLRNTVTENMLSDPALVPDKDVEDYIMNRGRGWVYEVDDIIVGFSIVSITDKNVWALFVQPGFDKMGIGRQLHDIMMDWYFTNTSEPVWLSTAPGTRAADFYRKAGWKEAGTYGKGEIKFVMTPEDWHQLSNIKANNG